MYNYDIDNRDGLDLLDKQFLGVIEDIKDPRKEGRAKIRIVAIHDDIPTADLPWAYPKAKSMYFGKDGKAGSVSIPKVGSIVAVRFDNGNPYSPEYFAIHELAQDAKDHLSQDGEYEGSHLILFDGDQELKLWFSANKGLTFQLKDAKINIDKDNLITIETTGNVVVKAKNVTVDHTNVLELGKGASEKLVLGDTFLQLFNQHTHLGNLGAPTSPPTVPMTLIQHLSGKGTNPVVKTK
jgi:hypothetical protein